MIVLNGELNNLPIKYMRQPTTIEKIVIYQKIRIRVNDYDSLNQHQVERYICTNLRDVLVEGQFVESYNHLRQNDTLLPVCFPELNKFKPDDLSYFEGWFDSQKDRLIVIDQILYNLNKQL